MDAKERESLIQLIQEQLEELLLSDRLSEAEKAAAVEQALKILKTGAKEELQQ